MNRNVNVWIVPKWTFGWIYYWVLDEFINLGINEWMNGSSDLLMNRWTEESMIQSTERTEWMGFCYEWQMDE